ncbi:MAG: FAD-binding oxidoreductase, partial [Acidobacteria bacterium]|nr:FAD-binding oxidoreductase [Acidobacteriota bacterium]
MPGVPLSTDSKTHRDLTRALQKLLGQDAVLSKPEDLILYEYDGSVEKGRPDVVVFPSTTTEVSQIVRIAAQHNIPVL